MELKSAFAPLTRLSLVTRTVTDFREAADAARSWRPPIALIEMTGDLAALRSLCAELRAASPETTLAGVFRTSIFPPEASESEVLIEAIRAGLVDFVRRPVSSRDLQDLFDRVAKRGHAGPARFGTIVSFLSNKGGVGKSTLAVNAACGLAVKHPGEVLLIDGSLQMGVCAPMLDLRPATSLMDIVREKDRLDERLIRELVTRHACGLDLLAAPASAVDATEIDDAIISRLLTLARRTYRFVVVDTFPMLDRVVMAILDLSDRTYIVLENVVPTVLSGVRFLELLRELKAPEERIRVVVNRYQNSAGNPSTQDVSERLARNVDFILPYDKSVIAAANTGVPYVLNSWRWSRRSRALLRLIGDIEEVSQKAKPETAGATDGAAASANGYPVRQSSSEDGAKLSLTANEFSQ